MASKKTEISAVILTGAAAILIPWLCIDEGNSLKSYQDVAGIWTICNGHAYIPPNTVMTQPQCDALTKTDAGRFLAQVAAVIDTDKIISKPHPDQIMAAYAHFAYNIGMANFTRSKTLTFEKQGNLPASCAAMMNWLIAGGKDCTEKINNCYGLVTRRTGERDMCLKGLKP